MKLNYTIEGINRLIKRNDVLFEFSGDSSTCYSPTKIERQNKIVVVIHEDGITPLNKCKILVLKSDGWNRVYVK